MIKFEYQKTARVASDIMQKQIIDLKPELAHMHDALQKQYSSEFASLYCPFDQEMIAQVKQLVSVKLRLQPAMLVVVGIGGSNLGTQAIVKALDVQGIDVLFIDTVDPDQLHSITLKIEQLLTAGKEILINVVSKSGTTTEVAANFKILYALIKTYRPTNYRNFIVITTGKESELAAIAEEEGIDMLEVPELVGGRYSVFSAVGLFPLLLAGVNIDQLLIGARNAIENSFNGVDNTAVTSAVLMNENWKNGCVVHNFFFFATRLEFLGKWYRQLMGESIGKENEEGKAVGIIPMTSIGSVDLHSVAQLYLAGPHNIYTSFVTVTNFDHHIKIPATIFPNLDSMANGKYLTEIMHAISKGTQQAYIDRLNPFCSYTLSAINSETLGWFMQMQMIQMMLLGKLLRVNPFTQPNVEKYKIRTREILGE
ncbi:hypothetical protein A3F06_00845 [candidate division TM6 bacterium RIFCSPHIGHO2_12_FULL_36_22]|nr:MAG: hypothetical protein A3F06_00845 [candidate division TM6 bacterium RIFCSPHIGHO2_12_FULL_36_22]